MEIIGPPMNATRNMPISGELKRVLEKAAAAVQIEKIIVVSGGQPAKGEPGTRTGSTRHDHGRAADIKLVKAGKTLAFTDQGGNADIEAFVTAAAAHGATGIGAGEAYMGTETVHIGFGKSPDDSKTLAWGAGGKAANAPAWLVKAAKQGWDKPAART